MATLIAHLKIFEGKEKEFEKVAREMYVETHKEPQCRCYEYYRREEPGYYFAIESFDDFNAFIEHQKSPHHEAPDWGSLLESVRVEWLDPLQGASSYPPTDPQPLAKDADALTKKYVDMHQFNVGWWKKMR